MPKSKNRSKVNKSKPLDFVLLVTILLLLALGIVMILSASSPTSLAETGNSYTYVTKQIKFAILGITLMIIISKIDYKRYEKLYKLAYIASVIILALVPIIGYEVGGAKRWINVLGITSFQPSEIAKIGIIIFFAGYLSKNRDDLKNLKKGFLKSFIFLIPIAIILLIFQTHLSATIVIIAIVSVMMLVAGCRLLHFITVGSIMGAIGAIGVYILAKFANIGTFRLSRVTSFLNPWADPQGTGWQAIQNLYAIGSGGLFGVGLR